MVNRIKLADGKYCYTGPNCAWHSPNGVSGARRDLKSAETLIVNARTMEQFESAQYEYEKALKRYDTTTAGIEELQEAVRKSDGIEKTLLIMRLDEARDRALVNELEQEELWELEQEDNKKSKLGQPQPVSFEISDVHTYKTPTTTIRNPDDYYPARVGSKYTDKWRSAKDIAKDIRADLKEAQKAGYIPKNVKYSVTKDSYAGGQSVTIKVLNLKDSDLYQENTHSIQSWDRYVPSPKANEFKNRLSIIANAYNSDSSDIQTDYFNVLYHSSVILEDEQSAEFRIKEAARLKANREAKAKK